MSENLQSESLFSLESSETDKVLFIKNGVCEIVVNYDSQVYHIGFLDLDETESMQIRLLIENRDVVTGYKIEINPKNLSIINERLNLNRSTNADNDLRMSRIIQVSNEAKSIFKCNGGYYFPHSSLERDFRVLMKMYKKSCEQIAFKFQDILITTKLG